MWEEEMRRVPGSEHDVEDRLRHFVVWLAATNVLLLLVLALGGLAYVKLLKETQGQSEEIATQRVALASLSGRIDGVEREALRRQEAERLLREEVDAVIAEALMKEAALRQQVDSLIAQAVREFINVYQEDVNRLHQRVNCIINYLNYGFPTVC